MAKGLRSKSKRKVKAIRRIEIEPVIRSTLIKTLSIDASKLRVPYVTSKTLAEAQAFHEEPEKTIAEGTLESIPEEPKLADHQIYKNLKNEHGNYPVWMNKRAIKKLKKKTKSKH